MPDQHRQGLLERLDAIIAGGPATRVVFGLPGGHPPPGAGMVPGARVSLVTAGTKHILGWDGRAVVAHRLARGEAMVMPPYGWTVPQYDSPRVLFAIVRHGDFTRYLWSDHDGLRGPPPAPDLWFHTSRPMPAGPAQALSALAELAHGGPPVAPQLLWVFLCFARHELAAAPSSRMDRSRATWSALLGHLHEHLEQELSRDGLARRFRLHPSYVSLLFAKHGGESFSAHLTRLRLERANALLRGDMPVQEVARRCGFAEPGYFIKVFKKRFGTTPGRSRRG
jgi:AraC-like DNA-binding protein